MPKFSVALTVQYEGKKRNIRLRSSFKKWLVRRQWFLDKCIEILLVILFIIAEMKIANLGH